MDPPIQFQTNVSVVTDDETDIVKQIFLRDPDGYYIEIGQSHVLTKFCLGHKKYDAFTAFVNQANQETDSDESLNIQEASKKGRVGLFAFFKLC